MHFPVVHAIRYAILNKSHSLVKEASQKITVHKRFVTHTPSGGFCPEPDRTPFGLFGLVCAVVPGLLIGATISKYMANFLEENELFVPSDDDDDDDDD
ncbi:essential MCU regulator, mitochondrial isoform X1 [Diaphorina citri]|uniref:Essential MCU regulator, mitochondrial n=1 Tax=Diaphorina citri TaxID=121845 RepID=A0A3Q0JER8_DIACI|nr:essential MCU regulator, mitochondrial isoform X1 [Diaphorina citri]